MIEIQITDDFDLDRIADSGQCFRWQKEASGAYRIIHKEYGLRIRPVKDGIFELSCSEEEFRDIWHDYFDLGTDYRAVRGRISKEEDPFLYKACEYGKGIRILRQDPWEMLISFIISQNKNIPAIKKSIELLCEAAGRYREDACDFGGDACDASSGGYYLFPSPEEILTLSDETLAACRLGYRCRYVKAAAADVAEGRLDLSRLQSESGRYEKADSEAAGCETVSHEAGNHKTGSHEVTGYETTSNEAAGYETAISALTNVLGVGIKVANCISLFGLHQIDAFPVDVWIRRILENEYPEGYPKEKYSPYNGIYQQYMFYYYRATGNRERMDKGWIVDKENAD